VSSAIAPARDYLKFIHAVQQTLQQSVWLTYDKDADVLYVNTIAAASPARRFDKRHLPQIVEGKVENMGMPTLEEIITTFVDYYQGQIQRIESLCDKYESPEAHYIQTFQKILFVAILDALSKSVFPNRDNRGRFVSFIEKFASWADAERVSLTHIAALATRRPEPDYEQLRAFCSRRLATWIPNGKLIYLPNDPEPREVEPLWPSSKDYQENGKRNWKWERYQHVHLLYQYRNMLVHEFHKPGSGSNIAELAIDEPYYMHYHGESPSPIDNWTLVYPRKFLQKLCKTSLHTLESYFRKNSLDPTLHYNWGDLWIDELN